MLNLSVLCEWPWSPQERKFTWRVPFGTGPMLLKSLISLLTQHSLTHLSCSFHSQFHSQVSTIFNFWQEWNRGREGHKYSAFNGLFCCLAMYWLFCWLNVCLKILSVDKNSIRVFKVVESWRKLHENYGLLAVAHYCTLVYWRQYTYPMNGRLDFKQA